MGIIRNQGLVLNPGLTKDCGINSQKDFCADMGRISHSAAQNHIAIAHHEVYQIPIFLLTQAIGNHIHTHRMPVCRHWSVAIPKIKQIHLFSS